MELPIVGALGTMVLSWALQVPAQFVGYNGYELGKAAIAGGKSVVAEMERGDAAIQNQFGADWWKHQGAPAAYE